MGAIDSKKVGRQYDQLNDRTVLCVSYAFGPNVTVFNRGAVHMPVQTGSV